MIKPLFGKLTGTHLTILALGAMLAPSVLQAVPQFSNVAVLDPVSGRRASVDTDRRLVVSDPALEYSHSPGQSVDIFFNLFNNACATTYTVPAGQALVVTAMSGRNVKVDTSQASASWFLYNGANCSGTSVSAGGTSDVVAPIETTFGENGILIPAGGSLSFQPSNNNGYAYAHGFLVPAAAASGAAPVMASNAAAIAAKESALRHR